ncbi:hypothetical protein N7540_005455 [Penicillium herquei]|nr:hypothetical protein N7540_005455 [Penicillium herquei]
MTRFDPVVAQSDFRQISHIRVVVHTMGSSGPRTSDNHWSIFLLIAGAQQSVRVNMSADLDYDDPTGELSWDNHNYQTSHSALKFWDFPVWTGVQVSHIATLIVTLGRDRYEMSGGGSGCRFWVWTIMVDLTARSYIAANSSQLLWPHLQFQYHTSGRVRDLNWVEGTFW